MKENISEELRDLRDEAKEYIENRYDFTKLHMAGELSRFFSGFLTRSIILYLLFFSLLFFSLALALLLGEWMNSYGLGLVSMGGVYLGAMFLFWVLRKKIIQRPVIRRVMALLFPNFDKYEEEDQ